MLCAKIASSFCLVFIILQTHANAENTKLFQSDEGVTETIIRLVSADPTSVRKIIAKYADLANVEMATIEPYIPQPHQSNCDQCAVSSISSLIYIGIFLQINTLCLFEP